MTGDISPRVYPKRRNCPRAALWELRAEIGEQSARALGEPEASAKAGKRLIVEIRRRERVVEWAGLPE